MRIERIELSRLNPAPYNPRLDLQPGDPEYERLKRSLSEFGCVEPLVWNRRTGTLVGGHQRLKVLIGQGVTEVEVSVVDLPPEREKALNVALNKVAGDWDTAKLATLLDELTRVPDFDVALTGFEVADVRELLAASGAGSAADREETFDVEAELRADGPPVTRPGDLIELGPHRLLCADASKAASYATLLAGVQVDLLFTDPPYNVDYAPPRPSKTKTAKPVAPRWRPIEGDRVPAGHYERWLAQVLRHAVGGLSPGSAVYVWNAHKHFAIMHAKLEALDVKVAAVITWGKESFALGRGDYKQQTEFCLYGWKQGGPHRWHGPLNESTLWSVRREPTRSYVHPTQKPLELAERAIRNSTRAGEAVLDPFLGSGTSLIACERTGRRCLGLELDPLYCDVIVRRYIAFAGERNVPTDLAERYRPKQGVAA